MHSYGTHIDDIPGKTSSYAILRKRETHNPIVNTGTDKTGHSSLTNTPDVPRTRPLLPCLIT
ncbi:MAG: hypothetical protein LBH02_01940 [Methanocalculaceae archaeon]|nr:hypothetical protein [Methanocalculaceae archaeon]